MSSDRGAPWSPPRPSPNSGGRSDLPSTRDRRRCHRRHHRWRAYFRRLAGTIWASRSWTTVLTMSPAASGIGMTRNIIGADASCISWRRCGGDDGDVLSKETRSPSHAGAIALRRRRGCGHRHLGLGARQGRTEHVPERSGTVALRAAAARETMGTSTPVDTRSSLAATPRPVRPEWQRAQRHAPERVSPRSRCPRSLCPSTRLRC